MGTYTGRDRARTTLASLARAEMDNDTFRREAVDILRRAIGFDGWCWLLIDPGARLPTRHLTENAVVDRDQRRFCRLLPEAWDNSPDRSLEPSPDGPGSTVTVLSAATGGDFRSDLSWREMFGPGGVGDKMRAALMAGGICWAHLHLDRDSSSEYFRDDDAEFMAGVAPLLAARLRDGLRAPSPPDNGEPGTILIDQDLSLVAATEQAWRWIDRLGLARPNAAEPLPGFIYAIAARVAASGAGGIAPGLARARLQAADGGWVVARVASLTRGPVVADPAAGPGSAGGYVVTLERARSEDLAPLLMRAWALTPREREVARLVIDGLSGEEIARALFISVHTARDHLKTIFGKMGVTRRQDLVAALAGERSAG